jgi:hypothetical protein
MERQEHFSGTADLSQFFKMRKFQAYYIVGHSRAA